MRTAYKAAITTMKAPMMPPTEATALAAAPVNGVMLPLGLTAPVPDGEDGTGAAAAADDEAGKGAAAEVAGAAEVATTAVDELGAGAAEVAFAAVKLGATAAEDVGEATAAVAAHAQTADAEP